MSDNIMTALICLNLIRVQCQVKQLLWTIQSFQTVRIPSLASAQSPEIRNCDPKLPIETLEASNKCSVRTWVTHVSWTTRASNIGAVSPITTARIKIITPITFWIRINLQFLEAEVAQKHFKTQSILAALSMRSTISTCEMDKIRLWMQIPFQIR